MEKVTPIIQMIGNIKSTHIRRGYNFQFGNCVLGGGLIRGGLASKELLEVIVTAVFIWLKLIVDEIIAM